MEAAHPHVLDPLTREQPEQLRGTGEAMLTTFDPDGRMTALVDADLDGPDKVR